MPTILETGSHHSVSVDATGRSRGFSVIEILLVVALIAIVSSAIVTNVVSLAGKDDSLTVEDAVRKAVRQARFQSASERRNVSLVYDADLNELQISGLPSISISNASPDDPIELRLYRIRPLDGSQSPETTPVDLEPVNSVEFAPDRSSSPFVIEINYGGRERERLYYDAFSNLTRSPPER